MKKFFSYMLMAAAVSTASLSFTACDGGGENNNDDNDNGNGGGNSSTEVVKGAMTQAGTVTDGVKLTMTCNLPVSYNPDGTLAQVGTNIAYYNPLILESTEDDFRMKISDIEFNSSGYVKECDMYLNEHGYWEEDDVDLTYNSDGNLKQIKVSINSSDGKGTATIDYIWKNGNLTKAVWSVKSPSIGYWAKHEMEYEYSTQVNKYLLIMPADRHSYENTFPYSAIGMTGKGSKNLPSKVKVTYTDSEDGLWLEAYYTYTYDVNGDASVRTVTEDVQEYETYDGETHEYSYTDYYSFGYSSDVNNVKVKSRATNTFKPTPVFRKMRK